MFESDEIYYADREYLTNSSLKLLHSSPQKFYLWLNNKLREEKSDALEIGKAFHASVLEGKTIYASYQGRRVGKDYEHFCAENSDKIILTEKDGKMLHYMERRLRHCPEVRDLMFRDEDFNLVEVPEKGTWGGIKIKGKADMLVQRANGERLLVDVKTTASEIYDFPKAARYSNYDQQAAFYNHLFGVERFIFVVIRKMYPYDVGIFECSPEFISSGVAKANWAIEKYKELFLNGEYNPESATAIGVL